MYKNKKKKIKKITFYKKFTKKFSSIYFFKFVSLMKHYCFYNIQSYLFHKKIFNPETIN